MTGLAGGVMTTGGSTQGKLQPAAIPQLHISTGYRNYQILCMECLQHHDTVKQTTGNITEYFFTRRVLVENAIEHHHSFCGS